MCSSIGRRRARLIALLAAAGRGNDRCHGGRRRRVRGDAHLGGAEGRLLRRPQAGHPALRSSATRASARDVRIDVVEVATRRVVSSRLRRSAPPGEPLKSLWRGQRPGGRPARDGLYAFRLGCARLAVRSPAGRFRLHGHRFPVVGAHGTRGPIGDFGAPRSGGRVHEGFDVTAPCGTPLLAIRAGRVERDGLRPRALRPLHRRSTRATRVSTTSTPTCCARPTSAGATRSGRASGSARSASPATRPARRATSTSSCAARAGSSTPSPPSGAGTATAEPLPCGHGAQGADPRRDRVGGAHRLRRGGHDPRQAREERDPEGGEPGRPRRPAPGQARRSTARTSSSTSGCGSSARPASRLSSTAAATPTGRSTSSPTASRCGTSR